MVNYRVVAIIAPLQSDQDNQAYGYAYETACSSGAECTAALVEFNANLICISAMSNNQTDMYCTGTCLTLSNNVFNACPNVSSS